MEVRKITHVITVILSINALVPNIPTHFSILLHLTTDIFHKNIDLNSDHLLD